MKALFLGHTTAVPSTSAVNYTAFDGKTPAWASTSASVEQVIPHNLDLSRLHVAVQVAPGASRSRSFTVYKNGVATALTCTISGTATSNADDDAGHTVSFTAGDRISLGSGPTTTPTAPAAIVWTAQQEATSMFAVLFGVTAISAATYLSPAAGNSSSTFTSVCSPIPFGCTIKNLYVRLNTAPGTGTSWTFALATQAADQAVTTTISDTNTANSDLAHSYSASTGDRIAIHATVSGTVASSSIYGGFSIQPTTDGDACWFSAHSNTVTANNVTNYSILHGAASGYNTTEAVGSPLTRVLACDLKGMYALLSGVSGVGADYNMTVRKNGTTNTSVIVNIAGNSLITGSISGQTVSIADDETLDIEIVPTGAPTVRRILTGVHYRIVDAVTQISGTDSGSGTDASTLAAQNAVQDFASGGIPGTSTTTLDNFNRANEGPPPTGWTVYGATGLSIVSNQLAPIGTTDNAIYWTLSIGGANVEAFVDISTLPAAGGKTVVFARDDILGQNYNVVHIPQSGVDTISLYRADASVHTLIGGPWNQDLANGDSIGIRCVGSSIQAWAKISGSWTLIGSVTDATYSGASPNNKVAIYNYGNGSSVARYDNFGGGVISATSIIENGVVAIPVSGTDSGTGTDASILAISGTDSGAGADALTLTAQYLVQDLVSGGLPGDQTTTIDNFNRANEGPPMTGWATWVASAFEGAPGALRVVSNRCVGNVSGLSFGYWTTSIGGLDVEVYATSVNNALAYVAARLDPTASNGYLCYLNGTRLYLNRVDGGVGHSLANFDTGGVAANDKIGIRCRGSVIEAWYKGSGGTAPWTMLGYVVDTTYSGASPNNKVGLMIFGTANALDDFGGGVIVAPGVVENGFLFIPPVFVSGTDSGSGSDASVTNAVLSVSDTGTTTLETAGIPISGTDTGSGTDTAQVTLAVSDGDTGYGSDSKPKMATADGIFLFGSGIYSEVPIVSAALPVTDSGAATEITSLTPVYADAGAVTENVNLARTIDDIGVTIDSSIFGSAVPPTDFGIGTEIADVAVVIAGADSSVGLDRFNLSRETGDTGSGQDLHVLVSILSITVSDAGVFVDPLTSFVRNVADFTFAEDSASLQAGNYFILNDSGTSVENGSIVAIGTTASDSGAGSEASLLKTLLLAQDAGSGIEIQSYLAALSDSDAGSGSMAQSASAVFVLTDSGSVIESYNKGFVVLDIGAGSEVPSFGFLVSEIAVGAEITSTAREISDSGVGLISLGNVLQLIEDVGAGYDLASVQTNITYLEGGTGRKPAMSQIKDKSKLVSAT